MKTNRLKTALAIVLAVTAGTGVYTFVKQMSPEELLHISTNEKSKLGSLAAFYVTHTDVVPVDYKTEFNIPTLHLLINIRSMQPQKNNETLEMIKYFIIKGASINEPSGDKLALTPLHLAVLYADMPLVELLVNKGANVNAPAGGSGKFSGMTPLTFLQQLKHAKDDSVLRNIQEFLIKHGAKA